MARGLGDGGRGEVLVARCDLEKLDRVSLIAIKNTTGFDGLVKIRYRVTGASVSDSYRHAEFEVST